MATVQTIPTKEDDMPKSPSKHRVPWSAADLRNLKKLAGQRKSMRMAAAALKRTPAAVQQKAFQEGISFRSINRRRKRRR
jgi:hypothetical protein